jgi:rhomboid protease GluP
MCPHCRAFITTKDKVCPYCDTPVGPRAVDRRNPSPVLGGLIPAARFVTTLILTINVGMFLVTLLASTKSGAGSIMGLDVRTLISFGAIWPVAMFQGGEWWRLVTAGALHGGLMHILFNTWALMDVGANSEMLYGQKRMASIYILSTIGGFTASAFWTKSVSVGASAGLFGLIGAMIALGVIHKSPEAAMIKQVYMRWAIYGLLFGLLPLRIDNAAHIGGLVTGFLAAWVAGTPKLLDTHPAERAWSVILTLLLLLCGFCFIKMFGWFKMVSQMSALT